MTPEGTEPEIEPPARSHGPGRAASDENETAGEVRVGGEKLRPILVITSGVQGVGKTTFAEQLASRIDAVVISSDVLKVEVGGVVLKEGMLDYFT